MKNKLLFLLVVIIIATTSVYGSQKEKPSVSVESVTQKDTVATVEAYITRTGKLKFFRKKLNPHLPYVAKDFVKIACRYRIWGTVLTSVKPQTKDIDEVHAVIKLPYYYKQGDKTYLCKDRTIRAEVIYFRREQKTTTIKITFYEWKK